MGKIGRVILQDITNLLNRPVFSSEEEAILVDLIDRKVSYAIDLETHVYKRENENLASFIDNQLEDGADYIDILF